jgi:ribosomal protein S18 acetylase RimI-like enzyme
MRSAKRSASSAFAIGRVPRDELAGRLLDEVYDVYCAALEFDPAAERSLAWREESLPRHAERDDFCFLVAREGVVVVGLAYGYTGSYGQWWTDRVAPALDERARRAWIDVPHFEVCELHVRPDRQRRGLGGRLLDELLASQPHDRALLTANPAKAQPLPFYRKRGWVELGEVAFGQGYPSYVVLGKLLG